MPGSQKARDDWVSKAYGGGGLGLKGLEMSGSQGLGRSGSQRISERIREVCVSKG